MVLSWGDCAHRCDAGDRRQPARPGPHADIASLAPHVIVDPDFSVHAVPDSPATARGAGLRRRPDGSTLRYQYVQTSPPSPVNLIAGCACAQRGGCVRRLYHRPTDLRSATVASAGHGGLSGRRRPRHSDSGSVTASFAGVAKTTESVRRSAHDGAKTARRSPSVKSLYCCLFHRIQQPLPRRAARTGDTTVAAATLDRHFNARWSSNSTTSPAPCETTTRDQKATGPRPDPPSTAVQQNRLARGYFSEDRHRASVA